MDKHTPTPWAVDSVMSAAMHDIVLGYPVAGGGNPILIATVYGGEERGRPGDISNLEGEANARFIVRAVNLHDELAAACRLGLARIESDLESTIHRTGEGDTFRAVLAKVEGR